LRPVQREHQAGNDSEDCVKLRREAAGEIFHETQASKCRAQAHSGSLFEVASFSKQTGGEKLT
ncbi:MAG TPA: hypothetical protein VE010_19465, partial [Thermoanaerobaculia bacterium]|nr:hypothetical protein [Thermoanaerobaculia bacterium]